jgi:hypothetical protein
MSKFYKIKDLLSLSNYSKKYGVGLRKIYRYIGDKIIEHYMIDDVPYLLDQEIPILKESHKRDKLQSSVKILTEKRVSVKILTQSTQTTDNKDVNYVKILTQSQNSILDTSDVKLNAKDLGKKYEILDLIEKIKKT